MSVLQQVSGPERPGQPDQQPEAAPALQVDPAEPEGSRDPDGGVRELSDRSQATTTARDELNEA